ncbi:MAG: helix-turn-helix domain-containing protein [Anaerolineae bacterium]|nr:helix-turn-helix domain-containing protein [Anaerolineae bacterium]
MDHHSHDFVEVVYVAKGTAQHDIYTLPMDEELGRVVAPITISDVILEGDIFVIAAGEQHAYRQTEELRIFNILFMPGLIENSFIYLQDVPGIFDFFVVEPCFRTEMAFRYKLRLPPIARLRVEACLDMLVHELEGQQAGYRAAAMGLFLELLVIVGRAYTSVYAPSPYAIDLQGKRNAIQEAITFIEQNYAEILSLDTISGHVFLSPHYFSECFKSETGLSPWEYLTRVRLAQAKALLVSSDVSITDIAQSVGFGDSSYFSKVFKAREGISPRTYRKSGTKSKIV